MFKPESITHKIKSSIINAVAQSRIDSLDLSEHGTIGTMLHRAGAIHSLVILPFIQMHQQFCKSDGVRGIDGRITKHFKHADSKKPMVFMISTPSRAAPDNPHKHHAAVIVYDPKKKVIHVQDSMLSQQQSEKDKTFNIFTAALQRCIKSHLKIPSVEVIHHPEIQQYSGEQDCTMWALINGDYLARNSALIKRKGVSDHDFGKLHLRQIKATIRDYSEWSMGKKITAQLGRILIGIDNRLTATAVLEQLNSFIVTGLKDETIDLDTTTNMVKDLITYDLSGFITYCNELKNAKDIKISQMVLRGYPVKFKILYDTIKKQIKLEKRADGIIKIIKKEIDKILSNKGHINFPRIERLLSKDMIGFCNNMNKISKGTKGLGRKVKALFQQTPEEKSIALDTFSKHL